MGAYLKYMCSQRVKFPFKSCSAGEKIRGNCENSRNIYYRAIGRICVTLLICLFFDRVCLSLQPFAGQLWIFERLRYPRLRSCPHIVTHGATWSSFTAYGWRTYSGSVLSQLSGLQYNASATTCHTSASSCRRCCCSRYLVTSSSSSELSRL